MRGPLSGSSEGSCHGEAVKLCNLPRMCSCTASLLSAAGPALKLAEVAHYRLRVVLLVKHACILFVSGVSFMYPEM